MCAPERADRAYGAQVPYSMLEEHLFITAIRFVYTRQSSPLKILECLEYLKADTEDANDQLGRQALDPTIMIDCCS